jgi:3',5'-cyclic AMP phosphodiesterase CpdA
MPHTFLHISDLHIGGMMPLGKVSFCDPQAVTLANVYPYLPGNLGHSTRALAAVNGLYRRLRAQHGADKVAVIVTGDVTAFGSKEHFDNAAEFLHGKFVTGKRHRLGLQLGTKVGIIPGNHDYFAGMPLPVGHHTGHFAGFFTRALPNLSWTVPLPDGRQLRFLEIDCDHDFELHGTKPRITARASGIEHLQTLEAQLQVLSSDAREPRILLMHGSPHYKDGMLKICELMHGAHQALDSFCAAHNVRAVLCGHIHTSYLGPTQRTRRNSAAARPLK